MLNQMRALSRNWIGRSIMAVVLGFIILSFAVWGIGDRFSGFNSNQLAQVGNTSVTVDDYRNAYQNQLQRLQQQQKRGITNEEARRAGLDRQVLSRLLSDAVLQAEAAKLGLAVSDADIGRSIVADPLFKGGNGQFDANRFHELLRDNGLSEAVYVKDQRATKMRDDVSGAATGALDLPAVMTSAINRYKSEVRDITFFVLPAPAPASIPGPTDTELRTYYDARAGAFVAPEYRKLNVLAIVPADLVKPDAVSEDEIRKRYDETKAERFGTPEKRTLQQLVLPSAAAAAAAEAKMKAGTSFDALVAEDKKTAADVALGTLPRDELADKVVGDAAFSLPDGGTSMPISSQFGTVIVHVAGITPGHQRSLMDVSTQLRDELAIARAKTEATRMRDTIEEARNAGKTLAEAAASVGLKPRTVDALDAKGYDRNHKPVEALVDGPALLKAAFQTEIGDYTEVLQAANGGNVWYEVAGIDPARKLPLADVKGKVEAGWRADEIERRLAAAGDAIVKAVNSGQTIAAAAKGHAAAMSATNIGRSGSPDIAPQVAASLFEVVVGKASSVAAPGGGRLIFKVEAARVPPPDTAGADAAKLMGQVKGGVVDDVIAQYLAAVQDEVGVKVNQQALQAALRGGDDSGS